MMRNPRRGGKGHASKRGDKPGPPTRRRPSLWQANLVVIDADRHGDTDGVANFAKLIEAKMADSSSPWARSGQMASLMNPNKEAPISPRRSKRGQSPYCRSFWSGSFDQSGY
jgi:hypothetical protein